MRPTLVVGFLVVAAVAAPTGLAQISTVASADPEQQVVERINEEQAQNGPHSAGLIEPLSALALLYQERGDPLRAIAVIEQLLQVVRANDGLHSLEQVPVIRQLIANEQAIGNAETAWDLEHDLLTLASRHPEDVRTVPIFREAADKRMEALGRYLAGDTPPEIVLGCYSGWPKRQDGAGDVGGCNSGSKGSTVRAVAADAQRNYADAIAVLLRNQSYSSTELRELEMGLLRSIYWVRTADKGLDTSLLDVRSESEPWLSWLEAVEELALWPLPIPPGTAALQAGTPGGAGPRGNGVASDFDYLLGRESLKRQFHYEGAALAPLATQVEAFMRIADWDLLHSQNALALNEYQQAYRLLAERGDRAAIDEMFAPEVPVMLQMFSPLALTEEPEATTEHVDVAFEVTKVGKSAGVEILETSANVSAAAADEVVRMIKETRFRPRVADGELGRSSRIVVRYYLTK